MEDIRSLYRRAKFGGPSDRAAYADAIAEAARTDPVGYLSQLEYIICSGTGLDSFDRFMAERASLPLAAMRSISVTFDTLTEAAKDKLGMNGSERYLAAAEKAATYLDTNEHLLAMFEAFENEVADGYLDHAINGELNYARAIDRFGAAAVPDCLLGCFGEVSPATVFEYVVDHPAFGKPGMKQWLVEASRDLSADPELTVVMERVRTGSLGNTVTMLQERTEQLYREAVLTEEELEVQFTEAELDSLRDYSEFQHYLVTALRSEAAIMRAWSEACRADAELAPLIEEESCADLAAMLPTGQMVRSINEGRDQKTGKIPRFISKHHNLNYGEEDDPPATGSSDSEPAKNAGDYTRPTATGTKDDRSDDYVALDDETTPTGSDRATTNYYYNYYNSFNRNHRDDHSSHHTDNSVNKRIRSDNVTVPKGKGSDRTEDDDDSYSEGFKDFIGKVAKGIKGLTMRKSLANLQARDRPEASMVKVPPHLLGSGIPLAPIKPVREATTLEDMLDLGYVITEAGDSPFGLSKNDIRNIINRLKSKFNAEILFISDSNPAITDMIGPASVVETDRATIDKMVKGGKLDRIPSFAAGDDRTNFEKVILINAKTMASWKLARPRDLEVVISHEYGHVLTYDQLTQRDWLEYTCKQQAIVSLVQALYPNPSNLLAEMNYFYYKLKPEVLANRAANIDPKELTNVLFGKRATGKIRELDLDVIVNWNVPDTIINQTARAIKGDTNFSQQDIIASINISTEVYGRAITDTTCRNWFMNILKEQAKQLTEQFSESGEIRFDSIFTGETDGLFDGSSLGEFSSLSRTIRESTDLTFEAGPQLTREQKPDHGFNVITGEWTTDEIVEKLVEFLRSAYFEDETKVIAAVKKLAEDEHHVLGNVVMEPGLETMWTDRYHLEEMLLGPDGNVIFAADTGETILFEHIIGSNAFDPTKVTWEKLEALIDQYRMDRSILDELRRTNGDDIADWGRMEWGGAATTIFEKFTFPQLKALELPPNCQLEPYYDGSPWDDTFGARLVFTDIHDELRKFNDTIAQAGNVTTSSTNLSHRESGPAYEGDCSQDSIEPGTLTENEFDFVESADILSTVFEVGPISYTDGIEIAPGTMTEKELQGRLAKELARTYQPQLHRLYSDLDRTIRHDRRIVGNLKVDYLGNFTWDDPNYFENACLIGTRNEGAIFTASHFRNLDRAGSAVTMEVIRTFFHEHAIPMELLSGLGTEPSNRDQIDPERLDQVIFREHTWPIIRSAIKLPSNVNLYKIGTYDYDGFGIQFTDAAEVTERVNAAIGDGGIVRIKVTPIGEDEWVESAKVEPEEEDPNADPERPTSDHPIKDTIQDIDRVLTKKGAAAKKKVNDAINVGRVVTKPVKRTIGWIDNIINRLKDANETKVKEELADPHRRNALFKAIRTAIGAGALYKAGLLLNPIFLFLAVANTAGKRRKDTRLRSEVIGQLKAELEVTEEKIRDADRAGDNSAKYKLMRFKTELEKKLVRVSGGREIARII